MSADSIYESMTEEKDQESSALDEIMVSRIEIEGLGVAANEKEMTDSVRALPGVREVKIENGAMFVTYDPLDTTEKKIEEAVRASGNTVKAATTDTESPHPWYPSYCWKLVAGGLGQRRVSVVLLGVIPLPRKVQHSPSVEE